MRSGAIFMGNVIRTSDRKYQREFKLDKDVIEKAEQMRTMRKEELDRPTPFPFGKVEMLKGWWRRTRWPVSENI